MRLIESIYNVDLQIFFWCQERRYYVALVIVARQISKSADGYWYFFIGVNALFFEYYSFVALAACSILIERILYFSIKQYFRRYRPPDIIPGFKSVIIASDKFSFPSGHTSAAFLMTSVATIYFPSLAWILFSWSILVGWSRVMLGLHFPGDTIAGALLGSSVALLIHKCFAIS